MKYHINKLRPVSWSQISCFEYNHEQWFKRYILGEKQEENSAMKFGKAIGEKLASDPSFMPEVPRLPLYEYELKAKVNKIPLIGYIDAFDLENNKMLEYKSGKLWTKEKAESHGQISMYALMLYLMYNIRPEELDIKLVWLETQETGSFETEFVKGVKPVIFPIKKTMFDILEMAMRIKKNSKEMEKYLFTRE